MYKTRLFLAVLLFCLYAFCFGILWQNDIPLQLYALAILVLLGIWRMGMRKLMLQLKLIAPFVLMISLIYGIFILLRISPQGTESTEYWIAYGLPRTALLISSILAFRLSFGIVSVDGLLKMQISIHYLKYLILGRILYTAATNTYPQIREWQELIPSQALPQKGFIHRYRKTLAATLALVLYTMAEATQKGEMIDNRIETCHKEPI